MFLLRSRSPRAALLTGAAALLAGVGLVVLAVSTGTVVAGEGVGGSMPAT